MVSLVNITEKPNKAGVINMPWHLHAYHLAWASLVGAICYFFGWIWAFALIALIVFTVFFTN